MTDRRINASMLAITGFLVACQDLTMLDAGASMPEPGGQMNEPTDSPTDDSIDEPFIVDINNSWIGSSNSIFYGFTFAARSSGSSSRMFRGNGTVRIDSFDMLEGLVYDKAVHFMVARGADAQVFTFDGALIDGETMDLTVRENQDHVVLVCSTVGGDCLIK